MLLDTGPLGKLAHPRPNQKIARWSQQLLRQGVRFAVPEIADYELRRNMILNSMDESVARLDELEQALVYLAVDTATWRQAAALWAEARRRGKPFAADKALDGDVILVAQALAAGGVIVTENPKHLGEFADVFVWNEIAPVEDIPGE